MLLTLNEWRPLYEKFTDERVRDYSDRITQ
jgi:hypothetical protein